MDSQAGYYKKEMERLRQENDNLKNILKDAQVKLHKERSFLFSLMDGIPAYVYLQAKDYSIKYANKMFYELFGGYDIKPCYMVLQNRDIPCENCMTFRVFDTKEPQIWVHRNDSSGKIYRVYDYPFADYEGEELVLEMGIDITIHQQNEDSRMNLYANISHDLRTPITKIMGYSEALIDLDNLAEEYHRYAQCIFKNSAALVKLVNDLFELSKLETRNILHKKPIDPHLLFKDFLEEQEFYFTDKAQRFQYEIQEELPLIEVDIRRIVEVMSNMIDNAIRFTKEGDVISVRVYTRENKLIISIIDTGSGIEQEELKYIFNRFYQPERREYASAHCGLGLHICKTIIEQHGGRIWAESVAKKGAAFHISLPVYE